MYRGYVELFNALILDLDVNSISQSGSGFIYDDQHIITNYHVIRNINPSNLYITTLQTSFNESSHSDNISNNSSTSNYDNKTILRQTIKVQLLGYDAERDIAVLKVDPNQEAESAKFLLKDIPVVDTHSNGPIKLPPPLPIGASSQLKVGQSVIAIGSPFGLDQTLTTG